MKNCLKSLLLLATSLLGCACSASSGEPDARADASSPVICSGLCQVSLFTGTPGGRGAVDGVSASARFNNVTGMVGDDKHLYIADAFDAAVRRIDLATGEVTTLAGQLGSYDPQQKDGQGNRATFLQPWSLARIGDTLFVADRARLRRIDLSTVVVKTVPDPATGKPWTPEFSYNFQGLAAVGNKLYVGEHYAIWTHDPARETFELLAGNPDEQGITDGKGAAARFIGIGGLTAGGNNALFVSDACLLRRVDLSTQDVQTIAGRAHEDSTGTYCYNGIHNGVGQEVRFEDLFGIAHDGLALYAVEFAFSPYDYQGSALNVGRVRRVSLDTGEVSTFAGVSPFSTYVLGERDDFALETLFLMPWSAWADRDAVYVGTRSTIRKISKVDTDNPVQTLAGQRLEDYFLEPSGLAADEEHLYTFLNMRAHLVRIPLDSGSPEVIQVYDENTFPVDWCNGLTRIGRTLYLSVTGGIQAYDLTTGETTRILTITDSSIWTRDLSADGKNLYLTVELLSKGAPSQYQIWQIDPKGANDDHRTVLTSDELVEPRIVWAEDNLFLADRRTVARVDPATGSLTVIAGSDQSEGCEDGTGAEARFTRPLGMTSDGARLFIGDAGCHAIRMVDLSAGQVTTLAGSPDKKTFLAGTAAAAGINFPSNLAFDETTGALFVADPYENIIMKITEAQPAPAAADGSASDAAADGATRKPTPDAGSPADV